LAKLNMVGKGRKAIEMIVDTGSLLENVVDEYRFDPEIGPCVIIGSARINDQTVTVIGNDAHKVNPRFRVVYAGVIGLEEAYKMAMAVYWMIAADRDKPPAQKRPLILIVDTPGNGPGKVEEVLGIHKATGAYQLALAEARKIGHPIVAMIVGRAISGGFLCHGLQADHILSLSRDFGTMVHVMPLTSIARITKTDIQRIQELSAENPVFAAGMDFFYRLGGIEEIINDVDGMREAILRHIEEIRAIKADGREDELGPWSRGTLGAKRGGRETRQCVIQKMREEFEAVAERYIGI
jgi:biotin-independent malonate decarboxylase gamma subunit